MVSILTAEAVVVIHFGFILFVIFGGLLVLKYRCWVWLHIPAVIWGVLLELNGWICPLTTWENALRQRDSSTYSTGFIEHYLLTVIYPQGLTREIQFLLGIILVVFNLLIYWHIVRKQWK